MEQILAALQVSGDIGIWVLVYVVWKFDRRIFKLELTLHNHIAEDAKQHKELDKRLDKLANAA